MKVVTRIFAITFFSLFIVLGVALIYFGLNRLMLVRQSQNWAKTSGQIISARVGFVSSKGIVYFPDIVYRYTIAGIAYEGKQVSFGFREGDKTSTQEKVAQYPVGSRVDVFYNPESPNESCLEPGGRTLGFSLPILAGIIVAIFGVWGLYRSIKTSGAS